MNVFEAIGVILGTIAYAGLYAIMGYMVYYTYSLEAYFCTVLFSIGFEQLVDNLL